MTGEDFPGWAPPAACSLSPAAGGGRLPEMAIGTMRIRPLDHSTFSPERMAKVTLAEGAGMMVGLNCLLPGQRHELHSHKGQDKLYHVLQGRGTFVVGEQDFALDTGEQVFVPGGVPHGASNMSSEKLVVLVVLAPPPVTKK